METSKIDVLALASPPFLRLAMVTKHGCCGSSRPSQPEISQIQAEKLRSAGGGGGGGWTLVLFKSRRRNRIPPAVTEQIGRCDWSVE